MLLARTKAPPQGGAFFASWQSKTLPASPVKRAKPVENESSRPYSSPNRERKRLVKRVALTTGQVEALVAELEEPAATLCCCTRLGFEFPKPWACSGQTWRTAC
jgi:hypothetical protein